MIRSICLEPSLKRSLASLRCFRLVALRGPPLALAWMSYIVLHVSQIRGRSLSNGSLETKTSMSQPCSDSNSQTNPLLESMLGYSWAKTRLCPHLPSCYESLPLITLYTELGNLPAIVTFCKRHRFRIIASQDFLSILAWPISGLVQVNQRRKHKSLFMRSTSSSPPNGS